MSGVCPNCKKELKDCFCGYFPTPSAPADWATIEKEFDKQYEHSSLDMMMAKSLKSFIRSHLSAPKISVEELRGIVAQGYCTDRNKNKVVDPDLLEDIAQAIKERIGR